MAKIDRIAREADIPLERDVPLKSHRKVRDWAKLIGTARKLESEEEEERNEFMKKIEALREENRILRNRCSEFEYKDKLNQVAERMKKVQMPESDQKFLLYGTSEDSPQVM